MIRSVQRVAVTVAAASLLAVGAAGARPRRRARRSGDQRVLCEHRGDDVEYVELLAEPGADLSAYRVLEIEGDVAARPPRRRRRGRSRSAHPMPTAGRSPRSPPTRSRTARCRCCSWRVHRRARQRSRHEQRRRARPARGRHHRRRDRRERRRGRRPHVRRRDARRRLRRRRFAPGGASRIPDGTDTDAAADWVRNDFDLAGITDYRRHARRGRGAEHARRRERGRRDRSRRRGDCDARRRDDRLGPGSGAASPVVGQTVEVEGIVVGDFQTGGFNGYYLQDAGDGDAATSEGVFVYAPGGVDVAVGDKVHVVGDVSEFSGITEITADDVAVCATGVDAARAAAAQAAGRRRRSSRPSRACT